MNLSKTYIDSFCGNVMLLQLISEKDLSKEEIVWSVEGSSVVIRDFSGTDADCFNDGILLLLVTEGDSTVWAEYNREKYACKISVRRRRTASEQDELNYYVGDLHIHSTRNHDECGFAVRKEEFPLDLVTQLSEEKRLDFSVITDHGGLLDRRTFFDCFIADELVEHKDMIVFPGCESGHSVVEYDRYQIPRKIFGEIVTLNAADFAFEENFEKFCGKFTGSPAPVIVLPHPQEIGYYDGCGVWYSALRQHATAEFKKMVRSIEMGNGTDLGSYVINEYIYSMALDYGYQVAPSCNSDSHGPYKPGPGRTFLMAPEKSKEMFLDALLNTRIYACESGLVKLKYLVNGHLAPATLAPTNCYQFHVEFELIGEDSTAMPVVCDVISDYGLTVKTIHSCDAGILDFEIHSENARYFYLRLMDGEGRKTWSVPIWTGRDFDEISDDDELVLLDKKDFSAFDEVSGKNVDVLINGNPRESFYSEFTTASIVIDMKKEYKVCGLGHLAPFSPMELLNEMGVKQNEKLSRFASEFKISTSDNGVDYKVCKQGLVRCFGSEDIFTFDEVESRYVKFEVLSTTGKASGWKKHENARVEIGELNIYLRKE